MLRIVVDFLYIFSVNVLCSYKSTQNWLESENIAMMLRSRLAHNEASEAISECGLSYHRKGASSSIMRLYLRPVPFRISRYANNIRVYAPKSLLVARRKG